MRRSGLARPVAARQPLLFPGLRTANTKSLLLGTALASTLLFGIVLAPAPAAAQTQPCPGTPPVSNTEPIVDTSNIAPIVCNNADDRAANAASFYRAIDLSTSFDGNFVRLDNSGALTATAVNAYAFGIDIYTSGNSSGIDIQNANRINATSTGDYVGVIGIYGSTRGDLSGIVVENDGIIQARATALYDATATGIEASAFSAGVRIDNRASISAIAQETESYFGAAARGINADAYLNIAIDNCGNVTAQAISGTSTSAVGISADSFAGAISIQNRAEILATAGQQFGYAAGISADASGAVTIENRGDIVATAAFAVGIYAAAGGNITIRNSADITASTIGIDAVTCGYCSPANIDITSGGVIQAGVAGILAENIFGDISITNTGTVMAGELGIGAFGFGNITIVNDGVIDPEIGIAAYSSGFGYTTTVINRGSIEATYVGIGTFANTVYGSTVITNTGSVTVTGGNLDPYYCSCVPFPFPANGSAAILALSVGIGHSVVINNAGTAKGLGSAVGIIAVSYGYQSPISIINSGTVVGGFAAILANSPTDTKIINTGRISAGSHFAIGVAGASAEIYNAGRITGFVALTDEGDTFLNQSGGVFETQGVSDFGGGGDLFQNQRGGTVQAATNRKAAETSSFVNLERFNNSGGTISLVDGAAGDIFRISNTAPPSSNPFFDGGLAFNASGNSTLGVDAFLGGPGSTSDSFIIDGDVTGRTAVAVNNTNSGPGVFNRIGIPVVFVGGNVNENAFFLPQPIDTGFFDYDLFFQPVGSGFFELRSFLGAGAFVLPQLTTAAQDLWYAGSSTWFDRTADLRVLLAGGAAPTAYAPTGSKLDDAGAPPGAVPAV